MAVYQPAPTSGTFTDGVKELANMFRRVEGITTRTGIPHVFMLGGSWRQITRKAEGSFSRHGYEFRIEPASPEGSPFVY